MAPALETPIVGTDGTANENGSSKSSAIGIILPPPEVRNIVDKTATFVARNGVEFETRIRRNEQNNPKFNFLNPGDPYHAYYQYRVKEIREGKAVDVTPSSSAVSMQAPPPPSQQQVSSAQHQRQQEILKQLQQDVPQVPKEPPPEYEFIVDPPSISAMELDIVKLTAQFVARNGRQFLTSLMNRETRNYQFDFLRPQHSLFQYFTRLLEQYTRVLIPPKDLQRQLSLECSDQKLVLEQVHRRTEWQRHQEAQRRREEEEQERERVSYAQIDWHDFVVVETVDYQPFEIGNFPQPTTPEEVGARILLQERYDEGLDVEMQLESDSGEDSGDESGDDVPAPPASAPPSSAANERRAQPPPPPPPAGAPSMQPPPMAPSAENVIVRKDYNPKAAPKPQARPPAPDEYLISPITGERIPASKVAEHMRIGLLDPRWVEQRDRQLQEKMTQESVYAPGSAIESSLRQLAERRTDIFGVGDEETAIGKKIGEEERRPGDKMPWQDEPTAPAAGDAPAAPAASARGAAAAGRQAGISLQDQIAQIHKKQGHLAAGGGTSGGGAGAESRESAQDKDERQHQQQPPLPPPSLASNNAADRNVVVAAPPKPPAPVSVSAQPVLNLGRSMAAPPVLLSAPSSHPPLMMVPIPQPPMLVTPMTFAPVPMTFNQGSDAQDDMEGPPSKRLRNEDQLMSEDAFLVRYPGPLTFHVAVPQQHDKAEWKLHGQQLTFVMAPTDSIGAVKARVHDATGMPPAKQKLFCEGLYFKDQHSLAFYNVTPDAVVQLQVKERGGRKK